MNAKTKRALCGVGAVLVALALAIGGTYAYTLFEHKSNPLRNSPDFLGRLVEDFDPDPDWDIGHKIKKEVSVRNMGGTDQFPGANWGDIFVRVKLKEHMDVTPINYVYYPETDPDFNTRFMVDKNGDFVRFDTAAYGSAAPDMASILASAAWDDVITDAAKLAAFKAALTPANFIKLQGYYDTEEYWYVVTKEGDPNGQYGAFVVMDKVADVGNRFSITGSTRATGVDYSQGIVTTDPSEHENEECLYPAHLWDLADHALCGLDSHTYASWELGSSIVLADDWDGVPVNKWILDPVTGWATWGNALKPGESTDLLLESITPLLFPDGEMLYVIHADLQATDLTDLLTKDWDGDDWIIKDAFGPGPGVAVSGVTLNESTRNMNPGNTFRLIATVAPADASNKAVTWASSNDAVATVNSTGLVTAVAPGTATITVTTVEGGYTAQCVITVTNVNVPVTGVSLNETSKTLNPNGTFQLIATVQPNNATNKAVNWTTSDSNVATVSANGLVTARGLGTATITVTTVDGGKTATCVITVDAAVDPDIPTLSGEGPYGMVGNDDDRYSYAVSVTMTKTNFDSGNVDPAGSLKLRDIIDASYGSDYSGITLTAVPTSLNSKVSIGADKDGDAAILVTYYGTQAEWDAAYALPGHPYPQVQMTLVLHAQGYADTTIKIDLAFNGSLYVQV